ncbi:hypothetical protein [Agrobacterium tumefaciens]|nr:hypothetical protein [Agrobacterium tumefaciens]
MPEHDDRKHALSVPSNDPPRSIKRLKRTDSAHANQVRPDDQNTLTAKVPSATVLTASPADDPADSLSDDEGSLEVVEPKLEASPGRGGRAFPVPSGLLHLDPDPNMNRLLTTRRFISEFGYHDDCAVLEKVSDTTLNQVCPPHEDERLSLMDVITRDGLGEFTFERRVPGSSYQTYDFQFYADLSKAEPSLKIWLRAGQAEFKTPEGYVGRWGRGGASTRFDDLTIRPARDDIPALLVQLNRHTFVTIEKFRSIRKRAINRPDLQDAAAAMTSKALLMLAPAGQSYLTPATMQWKHPAAFRAILQSKGLNPDLGYKSPAKNSHALIMVDSDRFLSAETLQATAKAKGMPLTRIYGREKIFIQNRSIQGKLTGNYSSLMLERAVQATNDVQLRLVGIDLDWNAFALTTPSTLNDRQSPAQARARQTNAAATSRQLDERPTARHRAPGR